MAVKTALISTGLLMLQQTQITAAYPADSPSSLFERQDIGTEFCEGNGASWTTDMWTSNGMADFLNNRYSLFN